MDLAPTLGTTFGIATSLGIGDVQLNYRLKLVFGLPKANVLLAIDLMVYVVIAGKTAFLFDAISMNIGNYVSKFARWTMDTYAFSEAPEATQE